MEPILCKGLQENGFHSVYYARIVDAFNRNIKGFKEVYGSDSFIKDNFGKNQYYGFQSILNVDVLRKEIGLVPLYFHSKQWGLDLPAEYKFDLLNFMQDARKSL